MKKRIISLILVLVMASLALAGCAYSYQDDDLSVYAAFGDKAQFDKDIMSFLIEDGDFTTDPETRANKVSDTIYNKIAAAIKETGEKKEEGALGAHDILYYCYFITAEFDGKTVMFEEEKMKSDSASAVQLGMSDPSDLDKKIAELVAGKDIKNNIYKYETNGKYAAGDVVFVTYTVSYDVTENGATVKKTETHTNERLVLTKDASLFINYLLEKNADIGTNIDAPKDEAGNPKPLDGKTYSSIKVNWKSTGAEIGTVVDKTYTDKKTLIDTEGTSRDVKDVDLTYHIYPVYYMSVPELDAKLLINDIYGQNITITNMVDVLFGLDYSTDADKEDEKNELLAKYETKDGEKTVTLEDFITDLAAKQKAYATAKTELDKANTDLESKKTAYDDAVKAQAEANAAYVAAKAAYDAAQTEANKNTMDTKKAELDKADVALTNAKTAYEGADGNGGSKKTQADKQSAYDTALKERDDKVTALLEMPAHDGEGKLGDKLAEGYKTYTYDSLLATYNNDIRTKLAKEFWALIEKTVVMKEAGLPKKAVDETYDQLIENYQDSFYNGYYDSQNKVTNYAQYKGSFDQFLIETVKKDMSTTNVADVAAARALVRQEAESIVTPIVKLYVAADALGLKISDKDFDEYYETLKTSNWQIMYNIAYYGEDATLELYGEENIRHACQLDKILNYYLDYDVTADGAYQYWRVDYSIKPEA